MHVLCSFRFMYHRNASVCMKTCHQSLKHSITCSRHDFSRSNIIFDRTKTSCRYASYITSSNHRHKQRITQRWSSVSQYSTKSTSDQEELEKLFPLRYIFLRTSITRWMDFPDGVIFDVGYADTKPFDNKEKSESMPVILGIPDVNGSHYELANVLKPFAKQGYRVIIVNLPGTTLCRGKNVMHDTIYQMSVSEQSEFIKDFLSELYITRVKMIVTNRHSCYIGVNLCVVGKDIFQSLAMINPRGIEYIQNMDPFTLYVYKKIAHVYEDRAIIRKLTQGIAGIIKYLMGIRYWTSLQFVTYSRHLSTFSILDEELRARQFIKRDKPLLVCFGKDIKMPDVESTKSYISLLGMPDSSVIEIENVEQKSVTGVSIVPGDKVAFHMITESDDVLESYTMFIRRKLWAFYNSNND